MGIAMQNQGVWYEKIKGDLIILNELELWWDKVKNKLNWLLSSELLNHPKAMEFINWLNKWNNREWFKENKNNLKLVDNWIEILWDIFAINDEKAQDSDKWIWNHNWNSLFSITAANMTWWNIPDWKKYIDFLPWDDKNKVDFLTKVLGLKYTGYHDGIRHISCMGYYRSKNRYDCLEFNDSWYLNVWFSLESLNQAYGLRLLKN